MKYLSALFLALMLLSTAHAMTIVDYDAMSQSDQERYISMLLNKFVDSLKAAGETEMVKTVRDLFMLDPENPLRYSLGYREYLKLLEIFRGLTNTDAHGYSKRIEVIFAIVLKTHGINAPKNILHIMDDFKPTGHKPII